MDGALLQPRLRARALCEGGQSKRIPRTRAKYFRHWDMFFGEQSRGAMALRDVNGCDCHSRDGVDGRLWIPGWGGVGTLSYQPFLIPTSRRSFFFFLIPCRDGFRNFHLDLDHKR